MRGSRLMIGLLVLATVLVDCVVVSIVHDFDCPDPGVVISWSLELSQVGLVATWLGLGRPSGPWRFVGAVGVLLAWAYAMNALAPESAGGWLVLSVIQAAGISGPLMVVRLLGMRVVDESAVSDTDGSTAGPRRLQFSILYLLGWMTALAVTLGTLKYLSPFESVEWEAFSNWRLLAITLGHAAIALAALRAVLGTHRFYLRIVGLAILAGLIAFATIHFRWQYARGNPWYILTLFSLEPLLMLGSLVVVRVAGYRIRWANARRRAV